MNREGVFYAPAGGALRGLALTLASLWKRPNSRRMDLRAFLLGIIITLVAPAARAEVLIFAAASLKEPLDQITARFEGVVVSYGGSGTLARQVQFGAPADIVLLANADWMDVLIAQERVQNGSVVDFASNRLVLIGAMDARPLALEAASLLDALGDGRIAVGLTQAVPAGIYAKAALQSLGLWDATKDRLAEVDNVRAALALVARGQTPLGIVYRTDTRISGDITALAEFPLSSHPPIRYQGALTNLANEEARSVLAFLMDNEGQAVLAVSGFLPPVDATQ